MVLTIIIFCVNLSSVPFRRAAMVMGRRPTAENMQTEAQCGYLHQETLFKSLFLLISPVSIRVSKQDIDLCLETWRRLVHPVETGVKEVTGLTEKDKFVWVVVPNAKRKFWATIQLDGPTTKGRPVSWSAVPIPGDHACQADELSKTVSTAVRGVLGAIKKAEFVKAPA